VFVSFFTTQSKKVHPSAAVEEHSSVIEDANGAPELYVETTTLYVKPE